MKTNLYVFVSTTRLFNSFLTNEILEALSFDFNLHVFSAPDVIIPKKIADIIHQKICNYKY